VNSRPLGNQSAGHLQAHSTLGRAGLIQATKSRHERLYELAPSGRQVIYELIGTLEQVARLWDIALEAFKRYAESNRGVDPDVVEQTTVRGTQIKRLSDMRRAAQAEELR
jgi:hypothetical protein